jgi:DNA-binding response OmpR family regulator
MTLGPAREGSPENGDDAVATIGLAPPRVLLVEDDEQLQATIAAVLRHDEFRVEAVRDGESALQKALVFRPDVALIDVSLPGTLDGFELARRLRAQTGTPLLFVTAADGIDDRLQGFALGADDYVIKPFLVAELLARIRAVLRRTGRLMSATIQVRDVVVDESGRTALRAGVPLHLTPLEFDLLAVLVRHPGRVLSKRQLLAHVWRFTVLDPNLVEVHMSSLRRKLEAHGPRLIDTERNAGYVIRD